MERIVDVEKVLMNEIDNLHGVYLYLEGDSWCAYERSAYYLAKLNVPVILQKEVIREGYDVVLLKALADDKLQFHMYDDIDGFPEWKASQLNKLPA